jgi:serine/threonine-protein kinase
MQLAIQRNAKYAPAYAGLSEAYIWRNLSSPDPNWVSLARDSAMRAVALNPDIAIGHSALGNALFEGGKRVEASVEFERAKDLDPKSVPAYVGLARIAAGAGDTSGAEALYQKLIETVPEAWTAHLNYGTFLYGNQRYDNAIVAWERARHLTPDNVRILRNEAAAYHMLGRDEDSASALQSALEIEPAPEVYANLGTLRFFQGRFADAVPPLEKAVQLGATKFSNWGNLGDAYRWAPGLRSKAPAAYSRAIDLIRPQLTASPADSELQANLAGYLAKSNQTTAALAELKRFEVMSNRTGKAWFKAAIAYEAAGQRDSALRALESAIRAKYSSEEIRTEQELTGLRTDVRYQQLLALPAGSGPADRQIQTLHKPR